MWHVTLTITDYARAEAKGRSRWIAYRRALRGLYAKMGGPFLGADALYQGFLSCYAQMGRSTAATGYSDATRGYHVRLERHPLP